MKIPDVSHFNKVSDWTKVQKNCPFIIGRATEGYGNNNSKHLLNSVDRYADEFIKKCEKYEIPYYLYAFLDKGNELSQAKFLVKTCKGKIGKYFRGYVLDVERANSAKAVGEALTWLSKQSNKIMLYTGYKDYWRYKKIVKNLPSNCAWWESRYGKNTGYYNPKYPCHKGVDLFQFTSAGKCDGINGDCDLNMVMSTKRDLKWFTNATKGESLQNESNEKTNQGTEIAYYPKYTGKSKRIDTVLKSIGVPVSYRGTYLKRRTLARKNGYSGNSYIGTAKQNTHLIDLACKGKLIKV